MSKGMVFRKDGFTATYIEVSPIFFFRVGLSSTRFSMMQVMWREEERRIWRAIEHGASIACACGPPAAIKPRAFLKAL